MTTSARMAARSGAPDSPRSSSVWMRTTVCGTPASFASSEAIKLTSSFCVTASEEVGAIDPRRLQR